LLKRVFHLAILTVVTSCVSFADVSTTSPMNGSTSTPSVHFVASATSPYSPIASMTINVDSKDMYKAFANHLDTYLTLSSGSHSVYMKAWDNQNHYFQQVLTVNVSGNAVPTGGSGVTTSSPANGSTSAPSVHFVASASSPNSPVNAMTINVDSKDLYKISANHLDTYLTLGTGSHSVYMKAWDTTGHYFQQILTVNVQSGGTSPTPPPPSAGPAYYDIQAMSGWSWCGSCAGPGGVGATVPFGMNRGVTNPSLDGKAAQFWLGGTSKTPYANALFFERLPGSATATHFILDFDFYIKDATVAQGLEFDVFYSRDGKKNYFLTECDSRGRYAGTWQVSNAVIDQWQHTGYPCKVNSYAWNHVTLEFYRTPTGMTHFVSASMNGNKQMINQEYPPANVSSFEMNAAVQLDGDEKQDNYSIWVDKMSLKYW
jgi:hypothetical protein